MQWAVLFFHASASSYSLHIITNFDRRPRWIAKIKYTIYRENGALERNRNALTHTRRCTCYLCLTYTLNRWIFNPLMIVLSERGWVRLPLCWFSWMFVDWLVSCSNAVWIGANIQMKPFYLNSCLGKLDPRSSSLNCVNYIFYNMCNACKKKIIHEIENA